ncbi:protein adenylyltransferase SelO [Engelhardtia mirabilis]|uniref:Protein nucleotidyltransferase YdiU n=1 Tax=Engelhardtia mirabilis TaxID=2528011 RepID=A0A518BLS6_9BACT|nr:hypothetical protein Pla133_30110 [Planctomycetes bacterium Pla133]QDV02248.1 hypothetical protein Pla86_30100 [Planctomycetes bacterium Pla86]
MIDSNTATPLGEPAPFAFDNSFARDMPGFFSPARPARAREPRLLFFNGALAQELGLDIDELASERGARILTGQELPAGAEPIAQAYAGHQFGHFTPQLGDGRALLLGEVVDRDGRRRDIQLKGSGPTHFSRGGDGLSALGPVLREYLVSEAMHALGVPTTRALAAATTGESVYRDRPLPGAVLTRVAASHLRVGTFEYFAARGQVDEVRKLADYAIARHDPHLLDIDGGPRYLRFFEAVRDRQARLIAWWMSLGFVHGVMNTDNTSISGETIDYGPCAFMERFDEATVFSSIDHGGRYAFGQQPQIGLWNLVRLAETLLPLFDADPERAGAGARAALEGFQPAYEARYLARMRPKLGLATERAEDEGLIEGFLSLLRRGEVDYTNALRALTSAEKDPAALRGLVADSAALDAWLQRWRDRLSHESTMPAARAAAMAAVNPLFIPRNHRVEAALDAAVDEGDLTLFEELLAVVTRPFDERPDRTDLTLPAPADAPPYRTFCGT